MVFLIHTELRCTANHTSDYIYIYIHKFHPKHLSPNKSTLFPKTAGRTQCHAAALSYSYNNQHSTQQSGRQAATAAEHLDAKHEVMHPMCATTNNTLNTFIPTVLFTSDTPTQTPDNAIHAATTASS